MRGEFEASDGAYECQSIAAALECQGVSACDGKVVGYAMADHVPTWRYAVALTQ